MSNDFVDTDVLVRLLTGDDQQKQARALALFQEVENGNLVLEAPDTVIADAVYVLASKTLYARPRAEISEILLTLLRLPGFHVQNKRVLIRALELYASVNRSFGDTMIVASMEYAGAANLYSYDRGFDAFGGVARQEP
jgi:predicted nucleic-acid-binding protein